MKSSYNQYILFLVMIFTIALSGCGIPSVHPLYEKQDLIKHEELTGEWVSKDDDRYFIFNAYDAKHNPSIVPEILYSVSGDDVGINQGQKDLEEDADRLIEDGFQNLYYIVKFTEEEVEELYYGGLVELDSDYYLDLYKLPIFEDDAFRFPTHVFVKVDIQKNKLILHEFKESFLKKLIENRQIRIKHEYANENFLLTASSKELQKFILKYGGESTAYDDTFVYTKASS